MHVELCFVNCNDAVYRDYHFDMQKTWKGDSRLFISSKLRCGCNRDGVDWSEYPIEYICYPAANQPDRQQRAVNQQKAKKRKLEEYEHESAFHCQYLTEIKS